MASEGAAPFLNTWKKFSSRKGRVIIGIIGTGNYAIALSKRLTLTGHDVIIGSRRPEMRQSTLTNDCLCGVQLTSITECIRRCQIIFVAIHMEDFKTTLSSYADDTRGRIMIDVSNREYRYASYSNAEHLAAVLPNAFIVKAFNSVSAYTMENLATDGGNHRVFIASNNPTVRSRVGELAKAMGFRVVDLGGLTSAHYMEDFVLKVFSHWKIPIFVTVGIFTFWCLYIVYIYFIDTTVFQWQQIFLKVLNKPLCMTAITVLALTYLPGHIASILQIYNGTKHKRFPKYLDTWLKSRKQFGLICLFLATIHAIASILMMSPTYYSSWYHKATVTFPSNWTVNPAVPVSSTWMLWKGEAACLVGIIAFVLMAIIGLTSVPSVGEALNWSEWKCIHSKLSYLVLLLSVNHVVIMGAPSWAQVGVYGTFKSITFLCVILPMFVLFLKLIFICPPFSRYLWKIRRGWERVPLITSNLDFEASGLLGKNVEMNVAAVSIPLQKNCVCDGNGGGDCEVSSKTASFAISVQCQCSSL